MSKVEELLKQGVFNVEGLFREGEDRIARNIYISELYEEYFLKGKFKGKEDAMKEMNEELRIWMKSKGIEE